MPFQSENQRKFLWAKHPDIAAKWAHGQHSTSGPDHKMPSKDAVKRRLANLRKKKGGKDAGSKQGGSQKASK